MSKMICPECGREFDEMEYVIGENGNPICPECAEKEKDNEEDKEIK